MMMIMMIMMMMIVRFGVFMQFIYSIKTEKRL